MLPSEILQQVRRIEIFTNRVVNETMAGRYESVFKGQGIEFDQVREYQPGDDIRTIDWNVTARTGRPFIKNYVEERELIVMLVVDLSRSMAFGTVNKLKQHVATELSALLAFSAIKNSDKIGLLIFTDKIEHYIPPKKGSKHVLRLIREVLSFKPTAHGTNLKIALDYLSHVLHRKSVVFLISDFFCEDIRSSLTIANRRHDIIGVHLIDPRQQKLPAIGWIRTEDAETNEQVLLNTSSANVRSRYEAQAVAHRMKVSTMLRSAGVDLVDVWTDRPYMDPLVKFFRMRSMRR